MYLWADVERAQPLLEAISFEGLESRDAGRIMELTDTAMAAFYPEDAPRRFFLAGWGNYPSFRAGVAMGFSRDWKKKKSETGNRYWRSDSHKLGVALGSRLAFASDGDPFGAGSELDPAPPGFEAFRRPYVLSGWFIDPSVLLNRFMDDLGLPIQIPAEDFFFGVLRSPANVDSAEHSSEKIFWELVLRIRTKSAAQARSLLTLISMARVFLPRAPQGEISPDASSGSPQTAAAALLFANPPEQEGEALIIRTGLLGGDRIALLFGMFPVYSK